MIILMLTRPNPNYRETLGTLGGYPPPRTHNPFNQERLRLQALLSAAILRHGLAPTPWHSSRTGPLYTSYETPEDCYLDILPRLQEHRLSHNDTPEEQHFREGDNPPPAIQGTDRKRTEAQHRGLDLLQILQALLEMGNGSEDFPHRTHKILRMQQYHRSLISHLFILLPILFLTRRQTPYRSEIGRIGRKILISLLRLQYIDENDMATWIHAQYFGNLWTVPVRGRDTPTSLLAVDWAETLSIWIHPSGALSTRLGHRDGEVEEETIGKESRREATQQDDAESQRGGLMLLQLLWADPDTDQPPDIGKGGFRRVLDGGEDFMRILASSDDLLTSLTHAVAHPLAEDLHDLSLAGVESVYGVLLKYTEPTPPMRMVTIALVSGGLLAAVLDPRPILWKPVDCTGPGT